MFHHLKVSWQCPVVDTTCWSRTSFIFACSMKQWSTTNSGSSGPLSPMWGSKTPPGTTSQRCRWSTFTAICVKKDGFHHLLADLVLSGDCSMDLPKFRRDLNWWLTYPSEKYESIGMTIPNIWNNKTCSKPPTSKVQEYLPQVEARQVAQSMLFHKRKGQIQGSPWLVSCLSKEICQTNNTYPKPLKTCSLLHMLSS